jgi:AcrR family transcriptional regulator
VSPLNEEQLHQIRDERKDQILEAAVKVFARRGFTGTKMSMIAVEASISHGLLYHYFKSKEELFNALVQVAIEESLDTMRRAYEIPGSPIEKLETLTKFVLDKDNTPFFMLVHQVRTSDNVPEKSKQLVEQATMQTYIDILRPLFVEGQQAGEIAADDPAELISAYLSVISGLMVVNAQGDEDYQIPDAKFVLRMIQPQHGS